MLLVYYIQQYFHICKKFILEMLAPLRGIENNKRGTRGHGLGGLQLFWALNSFNYFEPLIAYMITSNAPWSHLRIKLTRKGHMRKCSQNVTGWDVAVTVTCLCGNYRVYVVIYRVYVALQGLCGNYRVYVAYCIQAVLCGNYVCGNCYRMYVPRTCVT